MTLLIAFIREENGATSIEYAVVASLIALAVITTVNGLGSKLKTGYQTVANLL